jgi:putative exporter of polyketide antibiotics
MRHLLSRRIRHSVLAAGSGAFVLSGCDPNVRDTVLSGVEAATTGLFTTAVAAFFQSLQSEEEIPTTVLLFDEASGPAVA